MNIRSKTNSDTANQGDVERSALITGASRGLGALVATLLAPLEYRLIITARGADDLVRTKETLEHLGGDVRAIVGDVTDPSHRAEIVRAVGEAGRLGLLINNASELGPSPLLPLAEMSLDDLLRVFSVNVLAPLALIQGCLPFLRHSRGLVVNISSDAARGGYPGWGGYGSSKAALDLASLTLAEELRQDQIGVVSVDPGDMRTAMHQRAFPGEDISDRPLPEVTTPFWLWLFGQDPLSVTGQRFEAQAEKWEIQREVE